MKTAALPPVSEATEQQTLATWLDFMGLLWCHVPNGGFRTIGTARKLKSEGVKPGVPDVLIFSRPPKGNPVRGVAIELKRTRRGVVSAEQKAWLAALERAGWRCYVAKGAVDAVAWLQDTLGYRRLLPP